MFHPYLSHIMHMLGEMYVLVIKPRYYGRNLGLILFNRNDEYGLITTHSLPSNSANVGVGN